MCVYVLLILRFKKKFITNLLQIKISIFLSLTTRVYLLHCKIALLSNICFVMHVENNVRYYHENYASYFPKVK